MMPASILMKESSDGNFQIVHLDIGQGKSLSDTIFQPIEAQVDSDRVHEPEKWKVYEIILEEISVRDGTLLALGNPISLALPPSNESILKKFIGRLVLILRTPDEILIGAKALA
jgi:hypothetical protein